MAKEVKFKIELKVDGKGQLAEATALSEECYEPQTRGAVGEKERLEIVKLKRL